MRPYDIVSELESVVAEYAGAPYAVAVDSCTNALLIALVYSRLFMECEFAVIPKYTYVGVAHAILNAGLDLGFVDYDWQGQYDIGGTSIIDAARRFRRGMYTPGKFVCTSAHWGKILKIGRGGFILTDDKQAAETLRRMRYDGRRAGVAPKDDTFDVPGYHAYMLPEEAARGLMLMSYMPDDNPDIPRDGYADLSKSPIFQGRE